MIRTYVTAFAVITILTLVLTSFTSCVNNGKVKPDHPGHTDNPKKEVKK
jgi:hypothetical protein